MSSKFTIGQRVICQPDLDNLSEELRTQWLRLFNEKDNERLVPGVDYKIEDIDIHFPRKICVKLKGPYYFHSEFVPEEFFTDDKALVREKKIEQLLKSDF